MPFIGKQPQVGAYSKLDAITTSATATYNLTLNSGAYYPSSANHLMVSLNGVMQAPQDSFTISGATIIFASTLASTDSIDFIMALGDVLDIGTPSDGTVVTAKMQDAAVTTAKLASTLDLSGKTVTYGLTDSDMPAGSVLQVKQAYKTDIFSSSASGFVDVTGLSVTITPSSTSSKLLITSAISGFSQGGHGGVWVLRDGSTAIGLADSATSRSLSSFSGHLYTGDASGTAQMLYNAVANYLYSPSTTSAVTLKVSTNNAGGLVKVNYQETDTNSNDHTRAVSHITVMEIAG